MSSGRKSCLTLGFSSFYSRYVGEAAYMHLWRPGPDFNGPRSPPLLLLPDLGTLPIKRPKLWLLLRVGTLMSYCVLAALKEPGPCLVILSFRFIGEVWLLKLFLVWILRWINHESILDISCGNYLRFVISKPLGFEDVFTDVSLSLRPFFHFLFENLFSLYLLYLIVDISIWIDPN